MNDRIHDLERQLMALKEELGKARAEVEPVAVDDFTFQSESGPVTLSSLFGEKRDLLLVHNMGKSCNYCTLWADGFSGYLRHLRERAGFVLVSPDDPTAQRKLADARGWKFRMVQDADKSFSTAMGVWSEKDGWWPAVSGFHKKEDGSIVRTGYAVFGPGDDFCLVWPMFELLKGGANGWEPH
jgi:predicted dithiol-disulfide oxidoreductase (DUF899 family)